MKKEIKLYNMEGKINKNIELDSDVFDGEINYQLLRQSILMYEACLHQGTASTKTRSDKRGGGRKPWRQKGTGRARVGSIRSPIWRGGGVTFGPKPRDYSYKLPKKMRKTALKSSLNAKLIDDEIIVVDKLKIEEPKTKLVYSILENLKINDNSILLLTKDKDKNITLSCRNIDKLFLKRARDVNCYDILKYKYLMLTEFALSGLYEYLK